MQRNLSGLYLLGLLSFFVITYFNLFENLGNYFYDSYLTQNLSSQKVNKDIVIIGVDNETIKYFGERGNWTRSRYEGLLSEIITQNPKVIVFDYFFSNKSIPENFDWDLYGKLSNSSVKSVDNLYEKYQDAIYNKNYLSKIDTDFGDLIKKAGNVIIPYSYKVDKDGKILNIPYIYPINYIAKNAKLGYVNIPFSNDGVIRYRTQNINNSKSISQVAGEIYLKKNVELDNNFYINYFSKPYDKYSAIQFHNAYNGVFKDYSGNSIDLKDKIVLIGDYSESLGDTYKTPVSKDALSPGVEIIANEIQTIIEGKNIKMVPIYKELLVLIFVYTAIFVLLFLTRNLYLIIVQSVVYVLSSYFIVLELFKKYIYFDFKNLIFTVIIAYIIVFSYKVFITYKERRRIKKEFTRYMDKKLVENLLNNESNISKEKIVSILFLDIEGFTDISEKIKNTELLKIINTIFSSFNDVILKNNGVINKYIGDSIMVFWGEPLEISNHAYLACKTGLALKKSLEKINESIHQKINIRIGINTGKVIIGSIGDENFSDYTIIGDNVNLASRLEGINKYYNTRLIISGNTYDIVKDDFITRELDNIRVKGKTEGVRIYELLGEKNKEIDNVFLSNHEKALSLYYQKKFDEALVYFKKNKTEFDDKTAQIFVDRINEYKKNTGYNDDMIFEFHNK
ncbi:adenylate/guanylate cyclase domain-containing protein [Candidatus Gracilibacteria bacterium]|nr:adenylate/guanylate cyclase domain-containing protein [Candidatus Gracilibacteria bacterium]